MRTKITLLLFLIIIILSFTGVSFSSCWAEDKTDRIGQEQNYVFSPGYINVTMQKTEAIINQVDHKKSFVESVSDYVKDKLSNKVSEDANERMAPELKMKTSNSGDSSVAATALKNAAQSAALKSVDLGQSGQIIAQAIESQGGKTATVKLENNSTLTAWKEDGKTYFSVADTSGNKVIDRRQFSEEPLAQNADIAGYAIANVSDLGNGSFGVTMKLNDAYYTSIYNDNFSREYNTVYNNVYSDFYGAEYALEHENTYLSALNNYFSSADYQFARKYDDILQYQNALNGQVDLGNPGKNTPNTPSPYAFDLTVFELATATVGNGDTQATIQALHDKAYAYAMSNATNASQNYLGTKYAYVLTVTDANTYANNFASQVVSAYALRYGESYNSAYNDVMTNGAAFAQDYGAAYAAAYAHKDALGYSFMSTYNASSFYNPSAINTNGRSGYTPDNIFSQLQGTVGKYYTCFAAGTKITMFDNSRKNIEDVKEGDIVKSYDQVRGIVVTAPVMKTFHHPADILSGGYLIMKTSDGSEIRVTPNHQIYETQTKLWKAAGELKPGDSFLTVDGRQKKMISVTKVNQKIPTYNLEIADYHVYFAEGILAHNLKSTSIGVNIYVNFANMASTYASTTSTQFAQGYRDTYANNYTQLQGSAINEIASSIAANNADTYAKGVADTFAKDAANALKNSAAIPAADTFAIPAAFSNQALNSFNLALDTKEKLQDTQLGVFMGTYMHNNGLATAGDLNSKINSSIPGANLEALQGILASKEDASKNQAMANLFAKSIAEADTAAVQNIFNEANSRNLDIASFLSNIINNPTEDQKMLIQSVEAIVNDAAAMNEKEVTKEADKLVQMAATCLLAQAIPDLLKENDMANIKNVFAELNLTKGKIMIDYQETTKPYYEEAKKMLSKNMAILQLDNVVSKQMMEKELAKMEPREVEKILDKIRKLEKKSFEEDYILQQEAKYRKAYIDPNKKLLEEKMKLMMQDFTKKISTMLNNASSAKK